MKVFSLIILLTFSLWAESLQDINNKANTSSTATSTTSSSSSYTYNERGGYNTEVHIIGSEKKFDRVRFSKRMLATWTALFVEAQTLDLISQLKDNNYVNEDGTLNSEVKELGIPLTPGEVINKEKIIDYYRGKYTTNWIFNELKRVKVLDQQGFLTQTESFSSTFNNKDFDPYVLKVKNIGFKFSSKVIADELANDLVQFFRESSMTIIVTQEETTRYQSRKEGFWENFKDQMAGSLLGSVFYQDKINTVKRKVRYTPNYDILSLFSNVYFGFGKSTYANGSAGDIRYFGLNKQQSVNIEYAKSNRNIEHLSGNFIFQQKTRRQTYWLPTVISSGPGIFFNELKDSTGNFTWMSLRYVLGQYNMKGNATYSLGLSNYNSSFTGGSQLGLAFGWDGTYHFTRFLGGYAGLDVNLGFNMFENEGDRTTWQFSRLFLGLQSGTGQFRGKVGYEWVYNQSTKVSDHLTFGLGYFF